MNLIANKLKTELSERSYSVLRFVDKYFSLVNLNLFDVENMKY